MFLKGIIGVSFYHLFSLFLAVYFLFCCSEFWLAYFAETGFVLSFRRIFNILNPQFMCQDDQNVDDQSIGIIKEAKEWAGELLSGQTKVIVSCIQPGINE